MTTSKELDAQSKFALVVDLDGTLLLTDLLLEGLLALAARSPWLLFATPFWLLRGRAVLKREIALRVSIDVSTLPMDSRVLDIVRLARDSGRRTVLCSASDQSLVGAVAKHLGLFDEVLGSDGRVNLAGSRKAAALVERFGERGFDYIGNAAIDLEVWRHSRAAWVVNAADELRGRAAKVCEEVHYLPRDQTSLSSWLRAIRLHQWLKNLLVFVPLATSHQFLAVDSILGAVAAFLAFGLCASGVYLLNDMLDLSSDRQHPRKRLRPFASGHISLANGVIGSALLTLVGLGGALMLSPAFAAVLLGYYLLTVAYSFRLKQLAVLDVMVLAALYTLRIVGGAVAIAAALSFWLLAFSMFLFLSLALLKRYAELLVVLGEGKASASGRDYGTDDLPMLQSLGASSGYAAVLVLALYINNPASVAHYSEPEMLWFLCPLFMYWISRAWMKTHRGQMHDDPVVYAVTDRVSQVTAGLCGIVVISAI